MIFKISPNSYFALYYPFIQIDTAHPLETIPAYIIKIYCFSWLPFSVFCIISESSDIFDHEGYCLMITFSLCHIIGVSTCCTNPILYGFLNPNFKSVYKNICFKVSQIDFDWFNTKILYFVKGGTRILRDGRYQRPLRNTDIRDSNFHVTFSNTNPLMAVTTV